MIMIKNCLLRRRTRHTDDYSPISPLTQLIASGKNRRTIAGHPLLFDPVNQQLILALSPKTDGFRLSGTAWPAHQIMPFPYGMLT
jgi:hypothetical protein